MSHKNSILNRTAFTLIELLVVIAIIAILAAILFPVFTSAREKARQTTCTSNLKQVGLAFAQYNQDFDEYEPCGVVGRGGSGWAGEIYPYLKTQAAYTCPDDPYVEPIATPRPTLSYGMNENIDMKYGTGNQQFLELNQITSPSVTVMLFESTGAVMTGPGEAGSTTGYGGNSINGASHYATDDMGVPFTNHNGVWGPARHTDGANWLIADSHVKWIPGTKVSNQSNATSTTNPSDSVHAAGASNMTDGAGRQFTVTFSFT